VLILTCMFAGWLTTEVVHDFGNNDTKAKASVKQVGTVDRWEHADAKQCYLVTKASGGLYMGSLS
jgi:hypothetical protein